MELRNDELQHWGVLGMKWGVRRYQNADGSLTAAGKKRYGTKANFEKVQRAKKAATLGAKKKKLRDKQNARTETEIAKYKKKAGIIDDDTKKDSNTTNSSKPKNISEMTNAEIQAKIDRIRLEQTLASLQPKKISKGQKFAKTLADVALKTWNNNSQKIVDKLIEQAFKEQKPLSEYDKLKKENDLLNEKKRKMEYDDFLNNYQTDQQNKRANDAWRQTSQNTTNAYNTWKQSKNLWEEQQQFYKEYGDMSYSDFTTSDRTQAGKDFVDAEFKIKSSKRLT